MSNADENELHNFKDDDDGIMPIDPLGERTRSLGAKHNKPDEVEIGFTDTINNFVKRGEYIDLLKTVPTLREVYVGAGWELKNVGDEKIDVDLSCFLIDKTGKTREDGDFVFYNNETTLDGAVKHLGDSRTGDGRGDDEVIFFDLNGIPFDIIRIPLVVSIYDERLRGWNFGMLQDIYIRLVNREDNHEILRIAIDSDEFKRDTGVFVATLVREGPKWFLEVPLQPIEGGLAAVAKQYGIIVREITS
ncbi:MAG TPA: TerD family protein [Alphaproteobacteria bacterium]|jgi:tellurium resistance protein TerD